jgi:hypothetical protein
MTDFRMTGRDLRAKRESLGVSLEQLAAALSMGPTGGAALRCLEAMPERKIPGPLSFAVEAISDGWRLPHARARVTLQIVPKSEAQNVA